MFKYNVDLLIIIIKKW